MDYNKKYEGFLWLSDKTEPEVYSEPTTIDQSIVEGLNPFVVEGYLYDREENKSCTIKNIDGQCVITEFDASVEGDEVVYLPHRIKNNIKGLKFRRIWSLKHDPLCDDMEVLEYEKQIFVGFEK